MTFGGHLYGRDGVCGGGVSTILKPFLNNFTYMDFVAVYPFIVRSTGIKGTGVGPATYSRH